MRGYLAIILHTHLPYVRHAEDPHALEQRWLFEALTESYIPLLNVMESLATEGVKFRLTLSLTPTLLEMLSDELVRQRYLAYLDKTIELAEKEVVRLAGDPPFRQVAEMYLWKLTEIKAKLVEEYQGNILGAVKKLAAAGYLELITSAATHAYLPLLRTREAVEVQIRLGIDTFRHHLGFPPRGLWLPECGYTSLIDEIVASYGIRYTIVDTHALLHADPAPETAVYAPVRTEAGTLVFARDPESAKQVWSGKEGYPGDFLYREYYRDIGWDLDFEYIKPYIHPEGIRINTGLKYYRITGEGSHKEPYVPAWAEEKAAGHAGHFIHARWHQIKSIHEKTGKEPVIVSPYDTELYGHWWYEGPAFLRHLLRKLHYDQETIRLISPLEYPHEPDVSDARLPDSSWGNEGYNAVWLNAGNAWIYRHLHAAEERMTALAESIIEPTPLEQRALNQAGRELLLAQSSDWPFIINSGTATAYAVRRLTDHLKWFNALTEQISMGRIDEGFLNQLEQRHPLFRFLDYRHFAAKDISDYIKNHRAAPVRVLILSWEFPPLTIGGLGRHVYELSRALAALGAEVHVATLGGNLLPERQLIDGVIVHRTPVHNMPGDSFMDWVFQLNIQLYELGRQIWLRRPFHIIHGHDWLVSEACRMLAQRFSLPILATIHATEHGRNNGIHNEVQKAIDEKEREFMALAHKIIVCSEAMRREMQVVFGISAEKVAVIPNGVDIASLAPYADPPAFPLPQSGKVVAFIGRLVREKGVHLLVEAAGELAGEGADISFILAGRGPMLDELQHRGRELGIADRLYFPGFVDDRGRNAILASADVAVFPSLYEPFGIVALEAMAAGTPVIVSDTGGLAEIVTHEVDGLKVYPGDLSGLVQSIKRALSDPEMEAMAKRAREKTARQYSWPPIARQTLTVYKELAESHAQSRKKPVAVNV